MLIKLMTDAPKHNLALMRISAHYKKRGDKVFVGSCKDDCDLSYGSWLFNYPQCGNHAGGPAVKGREWDRITNYNCFEWMPDYSLYPELDYSLGYTWEYCPRGCGFCVTKKQNLPKAHSSIYEFHNPDFRKICLLNNNTFTDPYWRETFQEIWDADLTVIDENGYDLRLVDREKVMYLNRTKFNGTVHFAFDRIEDEDDIRRGLTEIKRLRHTVQIYVLVGFPDWRPIDSRDIDRCRILSEYGFDPFIMVYNRVIRSKEPRMLHLNRFQRMVNRSFIWRKLGFQRAWEEYNPNRRNGS